MRAVLNSLGSYGATGELGADGNLLNVSLVFTSMRRQKNAKRGFPEFMLPPTECLCGVNTHERASLNSVCCLC